MKLKDLWDYCVVCAHRVQGEPTLVRSLPYHWACLKKLKALKNMRAETTRPSARGRLRLVRRPP